jgi:uncharacterized protein (UPF0335 family)
MPVTAADFDAEVEEEVTSRSAAGARLRQIIERIEAVEEEIAGLRADKSDIFAEAKAGGFDVAVIRLLLRVRKLDPATREEQEELLSMYERAIEEA